MPAVKHLYTDLVSVTEDYLGPAAKRFIDRQIQNHLHKESGSLTEKELISLLDWSILALGLLTKDEKIKSEYSSRLRMLGADKAGV
jgi:hypothetical protein